MEPVSRTDTHSGLAKHARNAAIPRRERMCIALSLRNRFATFLSRLIRTLGCLEGGRDSLNPCCGGLRPRLARPVLHTCGVFAGLQTTPPAKISYVSTFHEPHIGMGSYPRHGSFVVSSTCRITPEHRPKDGARTLHPHREHANQGMVSTPLSWARAG